MVGVKKKSGEQLSEEQEKRKIKTWSVVNEKKGAEKNAKNFTYILYDVFKKSQRMYAW